MTAYKKGPLALTQPPAMAEVDEDCDFDAEEEYKWGDSATLASDRRHTTPGPLH